MCVSHGKHQQMSGVSPTDIYMYGPQASGWQQLPQRKGGKKIKEALLDADTIYSRIWGYKQTIGYGPGVEHCPVHTTKCRTESLEDFLFIFLMFLPSCPEISLGL